jgi:CheY-like chemotaxis protein
MESPAWAHPLVFVVDPEPDFLCAVQSLLEGDGYRAGVCLLREDPYPAIAERCPDLLVIAFPYHEPRAWALLAQLDADPTTSSIPIIATSTDPDNLVAFTAREPHRRREAVLLKPFDLDPLLELIGRLTFGAP